MRESKDITIGDKTLADIIEAHRHWIYEDCEKWNEMCADLRDADLRYADLRDADLRYADLRYANLRYADLRYADLRYADLRGADLRGADLRYANLRDADLRDADLRGADLRDADLRDAKGLHISLACPSHGAFVAWKKCRSHGKNNAEVIVKLEIPEDAKRTSATGDKCRADKAMVLDIQDLEGNSIESRAFSMYTNQQEFEYVIGQTVTPRMPFEEDRYKECASGIHFFVDRETAVNYRG